MVGATSALGALLLGIGVVYLVVACENLPGILGPTPGDTSPRALLGAIVLLLGLLVLGVTALGLAILTARPRPPGSHT